MASINLEDYKLNNDLVPDSIYYIPNYIDEHEEETLIQQVLQAPKPKWTYLSNRSLQNWGGLPHPKGMVPEKLPAWLTTYTKRLGSLNIFDGHEPNHILMNRYEPGQGIMAHEDGPLFYPTVTTINTGSHTVLNFYRKVKSDINAGDNKNDDLNLTNHREYVFSLLLWPRSLLVLREQAYTDYLHEIEELTEDRFYSNLTQKPKIINLDQVSVEFDSNNQTGDEAIVLKRSTRYSFTIRYFSKVLKVDLAQLLFKR